MVGEPLKLDLACLCQDVAKGFELHLLGWGCPANPGQTTIQSLCGPGIARLPTYRYLRRIRIRYILKLSILHERNCPTKYNGKPITPVFTNTKLLI